MKSFLRQLDEAFTRYEQPVNENHLGVSESNYIEVSGRDARLALEVYADIARNYTDIVLYGSNVYASNNAEELDDLLTVFERENIIIISKELNLDSDDELDEHNVTGAIAGYSTPNAIRKKPKKVAYATGIEESINTTPSLQSNKETHQYSESAEEIMDRKYEQLIEGYRNFASGDSKITPEKKVKNTIKEIAKKLQEIEEMVNHNSRLKIESGITSSVYGISEKKALTKISERLTKISERVRSLGE